MVRDPVPGRGRDQPVRRGARHRRLRRAARRRRWTESRLYFLVVWSLIVFGSAILLAGFDQPLVLVTISTVLGGVIMVVYSCLLIVTNRRHLPEPVRVRGVRLAALVWAVALLGTTSAIVAIDQVGNLL